MKFDHFAKPIIPFLDTIWFFHGVDHAISTPPLTMSWAGLSRWGSDHFYQFQNCEFFAIEQATMGNIRFIQDSREYLLEPGDVFFLRPGLNNWYGPGPAGFLHKRFVRIDGPLLDSLLRITGLWGKDVVRPQSPEIIAALLRKSAALMKIKPSGWIEATSTLAYEIIMQLGRNLAPSRPHVLTKALDYIERGLSEPLTNQSVCAQTGLSVTHFNRLFRTSMGMPPMKYVVRQRVAWAKRLLKTTSLSIKEVARTIGYENQLYFSALFKNHEGIPPKEYRASLLKRKQIQSESARDVP
jgi:AraC-like DNA-binding protein